MSFSVERLKASLKKKSISVDKTESPSILDLFDAGKLRQVGVITGPDESFMLEQAEDHIIEGRNKALFFEDHVRLYCPS